MEDKFKEYEDHLRQFKDAEASNSYAHAVHFCGLPIKPEGYDEYIAAKEKKKPSSVKEEIFVPIQKRDGYGYDSEGIPKYRNFKDYEEGTVNPDWLKKYPKQGINYDKEGIPEYIDISERHEGRVNPKWIKKYGY